MARLSIIIDAQQAETGARRIVQAVREMERELGVTSRGADKAGKSVDRMGKELGQAGREASKASRDVDRAAKSTDRLGREATQAATALKALGVSSRLSVASIASFATRFAALGGVALGVGAAAKTVIDFGDAVAKLSAITGLDQRSSEMRALVDEAKRLGSETRFTATQAVQGFETLARAGLDATQSIQSLGSVLNLAILENLDLADAARIVTTALSQFRRDAGDAGQVVDSLFGAAKAADTTITELAEALQLVGSDAKGANLTLDETLAVLDLLASRGRRASLAGTALRSVLIALSTGGSKEAQQLLRDMGLTLEDIAPSVVGLTQSLDTLAAGLATLPSDLDRTQALVTLFGQRFAGAAREIIEGREQITRFRTEIESMSGAAQEAAQVTEQSLGGAFRELGSAISGAFIQLDEATGASDTLAAALRKLAEAINAVTSAQEELARVPQPKDVFGPSLGLTDPTLAALPPAAVQKPPPIDVFKVFTEGGLLVPPKPSPGGFPFPTEIAPQGVVPPIPGLGATNEQVAQQQLSDITQRTLSMGEATRETEKQLESAQKTTDEYKTQIDKVGDLRDFFDAIKDAQEKIRKEAERMRREQERAADTVQGIITSIEREADLAGLTTEERRNQLELLRIIDTLRKAGVEDEERIADAVARAAQAQERRARAQREAEISRGLARGVSGAAESLLFEGKVDTRQTVRDLARTLLFKPLEDQLTKVFSGVLFGQSGTNIQTPVVNIQAGVVNGAGVGIPGLPGPLGGSGNIGGIDVLSFGGAQQPVSGGGGGFGSFFSSLPLIGNLFSSGGPSGLVPINGSQAELASALASRGFSLTASQSAALSGASATTGAAAAGSAGGGGFLSSLFSLFSFGGGAAGGAAAGGAAAGAGAAGGAAAGGAASGAAAGAAAGSVFPGIGTAIGAILGLLLGGLLFSRRGNVFSGGRLVPFAGGGVFAGGFQSLPFFAQSGLITAAGLAPQAFAVKKGAPISPLGSALGLFADGGIVSVPHIFPMADGNLGMMGEAGPEAIMPLKRDRFGRLGVAAEGARSGSVIVNHFNIQTPDADSFRRSSFHLAEDQNRAQRRFA